MKKILSLLFWGILFFGYNKVSYASSDIIIDSITPEVSLEFIEEDSIDSFFKDPVFPNITEPIVHFLAGDSLIVVIVLGSILIILLSILIIILKNIMVD